jgi:predicted ester cyclase
MNHNGKPKLRFGLGAATSGTVRQQSHPRVSMNKVHAVTEISMSIEGNKAIARRHFEEVWNKGRVELLDEYYALDVPSGAYMSLDELRKRVLWWHKMTPGFFFTILDVIAEGDKVIVYWKVNATYSVVPDPPPTDPNPMLPLGKPVQFRGMDLYRFEDGKMVSYRGGRCGQRVDEHDGGCWRIRPGRAREGVSGERSACVKLRTASPT